jgi:zinc transport system ATP-binding protein
VPVSLPPVIALRGVSIGYDDKPAVSDIDLTVRPGDVLALIGPNGSGKSTLVRGMLGLATVLTGEVELFGVPASRFAQRHRLGYVPQRHTVGGAIPSTVEEVVGSGRLTHRRWYARASSDDRAAVSEAIAAVGLSERRRSMVATLSGGQQRRVLIARALAGRPEVLIMDEPTAGVDAESQQSLVRTLLSLVGGGLTLVIVTHEITALRPVLTRVVAIRDGRITHDDRIAPERTGSDHPRDSSPTDGLGEDDCHEALPRLSEISRLGETQTPLLDPTTGSIGLEY